MIYMPNYLGKAKKKFKFNNDKKKINELICIIF